MKTKNKRKSFRHICNLIGDVTGESFDQEKYFPVRVIDESETGMRITSRKPLDSSELLTVTVSSRSGGESFPAEFVWMHKDNGMYVAGLKKI
jgi:hypothetical protein